MIVPNPDYLFDDVLETINKFIKDNKFIHYGSFAYNFYVKNNKKKIFLKLRFLNMKSMLMD